MGKSKRENEMIYSLSFGVEAEKDVIEAYNWYKKYSLELAENFKECLDSKIEGLHRNPFTPSFVFRNYRSAKILRFPYNIIFKIKGTEIQIMAVFHSSRNPKEWKKRI